jgi:hypothetical protein
MPFWMIVLVPLILIMCGIETLLHIDNMWIRCLINAVIGLVYSCVLNSWYVKKKKL